MYRVQNNSLDIAIPERTQNAIFLNVESDRKPYYTLISKYMSKERVEELILKKMVYYLQTYTTGRSTKPTHQIDRSIIQ